MLKSKSYYQNGVDPENIKTWKKYKKSNCKNCLGLCCSFVVEVTGEDLVNLGYIEEDEVVFGLKKVIKDMKALGIIKRYNFKSEKFVLQQKTGGDCIFMDQNKRNCTVYENRPEVCRNHPEVAGPKKNYCPYIQKN